MIIIDELKLAAMLNDTTMSNHNRIELLDKLHDEYSMSTESIPIDWIRKYASRHDPVCQVNIENMIRNWETLK